MILGRSWSRGALLTALVGGGLVACGPNTWDEGYSGPGGGYSTTTELDAGLISGDGSASSMPMLVKVDPNAPMTQTPGQGVGVFTQYDTGGHWYVWWTCDTSLSNDACDFAINISVAHGDITNARPQNFLEADLLSGGGAGSTLPEGGTPDAESTEGSPALHATTTTTTTVQGVYFDTAPGAVITLSAALSGEYSGSFLFFVQDDEVNGNYKGMLSDPLELQSSSP